MPVVYIDGIDCHCLVWSVLLSHYHIMMYFLIDFIDFLSGC